MPDTPDTMGGRMKALRDEKGFSLRYVDEVTGIREDNLRLWEKGRNPTDPAAIATLADFYGVTSDFLISGKQPETSEKK